MRTAELVGGLYGVSLGRAFFGESMFHTVRDASKVALVHLVARLKAGDYRLLDTQFVTAHLKTFGAVEVPRPAYHKLLDAALVGEARFRRATDRPAGVRRHGSEEPCQALTAWAEREQAKGCDQSSVTGAGAEGGSGWSFRRRLTRLGLRRARRRRACGGRRRRAICATAPPTGCAQSVSQTS